MKVLCQERVDIGATAEVVFDYVADLARWPMWFACIVSAQQPENRALARDEEVRLCLQAGKHRWQETFEATRFIRGAFLSFEAVDSAARRIDFRFERRGEVTRLACGIGYPVFGGWVPAGLDAMFRRPRVARELRQSLVHLKNALEDDYPATAHIDDYDATPASRESVERSEDSRAVRVG
ncbi:MAG: hypothetical protein DLM53_07250 [Candidatus Eremiobacter antarcticus]|nr:SRPBCC family protein [Candidatus Eremiobacteraeota bacterium]MBC5807253.1 SRPBCC family protein [Candidatus Eremiobacteraeota bacterium]PZR61944.1 MAG: hypothetical protein DLM53_07250 [Candidatus Eremiobacter sp. RRmetagenome_bin22]